MKRLASFMTVGLLACSSTFGMVSDSAAQEVPQTAGNPAGEPVPFAEEPSLLYATELMQRADVYARSIAQMSDVPDVEVREVSRLPRSDTSPAIFADTMNRFLNYYSDDIAALRSAMTGNPAVAEALQAAGVEPSDVVAAEIRPDLALRVYLRDW